MNTTNMFNHTETFISSLAAIGFYTAGKLLGYITPIAAVQLKETWHFQVLQEIAFIGTIVAATAAVVTLIRNVRKDKPIKKDKNDAD